MNLKTIAQAKITKKTVDFGDGNTADIYLKPLPFYMLWDKVDEKGNELTEEQILARRVAHCIVDEMGNPIFTYEQVLGQDPEYAVDPAICLKLSAIIGEETDPGKYLKTDSHLKKNSGANSSSTESAEEQ